MNERVDALHHETLGEGPALVLLHGWGLHAGVWRDVAQALSRQFRITMFDLPGHGHSPMPEGPYTLSGLADMVAVSLPPRATVLGWSLGGLVGLELALRFPLRIRRLVLIGSSPQFTADPAWPPAMDADVLDAFAGDLLADHAGTVRRFLALQVLGCQGARQTLARLKAEVAAAPAPDPLALAGGLGILRGASLVARLAEVRVPVALIHGERDALVPVEAARETARRLPDARLHAISGAGHAPFLSHAEECCALIRGLDDG